MGGSGEGFWVTHLQMRSSDIPYSILPPSPGPAVLREGRDYTFPSFVTSHPICTKEHSINAYRPATQEELSYCIDTVTSFAHGL